MAQKFKFSLEKLLDIRKEKEEESKRKFTKTQKEKQETEQRLDALKENYEKYNGIRPGEDLIYQKIKKNYLFALNKGIEQTEKELIAKTKELDIKRKELIEKQIERKTVDILKEKKKVAYYKELDRIEQLQLDEMALYAYVRNNKSIHN
ncbi:flagellar export protein FliJ [Clostridium isatidis]|uniref:Flagellar FliJ protein n=1 Tax=Clostridium isatidis TaxID=182773 RepID=A0A343JC39_9CLOT|nr:flagellar export protein FliJ [Clostridium isatidis]ASW43097.1 flagellar export protein FliJ [Clostridium isatidis]